MFSQTEYEPEALGLPGDNLNLYAVLDVFQKSKTLEYFEKTINDKETKINNLDLNNDNYIDYIEVVSSKVADSYSIVLRTAINKTEYQDIAVIDVYKNKLGKITVQIIGDKELYGYDYIVEPSNSKNVSETPNPAYNGNEKVIINNYSTSSIYYVNDWMIMSYLFSPRFTLYISPWHWGFYPSYWQPWTPIYYYNYWGFHNHYYRNNFYRRIGYVRYPMHYSQYSSRRNSSPAVIRNRNEGIYRGTYNGREYKKPIAPPSKNRIAPTKRRTESPIIRSRVPNNPTRPSSTIPRPQGETRANRPITPTNKHATPSTSSTRSNRQNASSGRRN